MIPCIARTCVAVGVDGLFMEVHDDPTSSPVDAPTQWPLRNFKPLLEELIAIAKASKVVSLVLLRRERLRLIATTCPLTVGFTLQGKEKLDIDLSPVGEDLSA